MIIIKHNNMRSVNRNSEVQNQNIQRTCTVTSE